MTKAVHKFTYVPEDGSYPSHTELVRMAKAEAGPGRWYVRAVDWYVQLMGRDGYPYEATYVWLQHDGDEEDDG